MNSRKKKTYKAYDVAAKRMVKIVNPKEKVYHTKKGDVVMMRGTSPINGNIVSAIIGHKK